MTQEEKDLLLKDLCARLPFHKTICKIGEYSDYILKGIDLSNESQPLIIELNKVQFPVYLEHVKPYLRPMSSMTDDEINELDKVCDGIFNIYDTNIEVLSMLEWEDSFENILKGNDWLNKKMFDYRGLIPIGLALEAKEDMYKF